MPIPPASASLALTALKTLVGPVTTYLGSRAERRDIVRRELLEPLREAIFRIEGEYQSFCLSHPNGGGYGEYHVDKHSLLYARVKPTLERSLPLAAPRLRQKAEKYLTFMAGYDEDHFFGSWPHVGPCPDTKEYEAFIAEATAEYRRHAHGFLWRLKSDFFNPLHVRPRKFRGRTKAGGFMPAAFSFMRHLLVRRRRTPLGTWR